MRSQKVWAMATIAVIQSHFSVLNEELRRLTGFSKQVYQKFFEVLVEESGHTVHTAKTIEEYQQKGYARPDMIICVPFPEIGNPAPGFAEIKRFQDTFGDTPLIVWSTRSEEAIRSGVLEDYGAKAYYQGTLLEAPDDFADMVLKYT